jgi:NAD-dependent SIR2 family protein deacetylase
VYFNHSIHVNKGVGCASCHGRVDQMPITWKTQALEMRWCLDCHRHPEEHLRPRDEVFNMSYQARAQAALGRELAAQSHLRSKAGRTDCYTCHR